MSKPRPDRDHPDLSDLIFQFLRCVDDYLRWHQIETLAAIHACPVAPGSPAEAELIAKLNKAAAHHGDARNAIRDKGGELADILEQVGFDSSGVLKVIHCASAGGGGPAAVINVWADTKIALQRASIQYANGKSVGMKPKRKRGPTGKFDPKKEAKFYADFKASDSTLKEFARDKKMDFIEANKMICRHRARRSRGAH